MSRRGNESNPTQRALVQTKDGAFAAYFSSRGLARLDFPDTDHPQTPDSCAQELDPERARWLAMTRSALERILEAKPPMDLPPLDLSAGTAFQQSVWQTLREIPTGQTLSYADVARAIRRPKAVRAVGQACGANPIPLLVPCHRVLASGGRLGGFSCGVDIKRKLLDREGVRYFQ